VSTIRPSHSDERGGTENSTNDHGNDNNYNYNETRTHYYGDNCPGGHLDDTAPFDVAAFLDYLNYIDNLGDYCETCGGGHCIDCGPCDCLL